MKNILLLLLPMILMTCQAATAQQQQSYQNTKERESAAVSAPRVPGYYNLKDTNDLKNEYLKISQRQKKTGWFLLGGGIVTVVAIIIQKTYDFWDDER